MVKRVLVAVDGTSASNAALEIACALADNYEAALGLLTVIEPNQVDNALISAAETEGLIAPDISFSQVYSTKFGTYPAPQTYGTADRSGKAAQVAMIMAETVVKKATAYSNDKPFKAVKTFISSGDPATAILECAKTNKADIIIMGHDQRGRVEALLKGSVAEKVQRCASCPVLIYCLPNNN